MSSLPTKTRPVFKDALLKQHVSCIYDNPGIERLERISTVRLVEYEWMYDAILTNSNLVDLPYQLRTLTMTPREAIREGGRAFGGPWSVHQILHGMGCILAICDGVTRTVFDGVTGIPSVDQTFTIPPLETLYLYRKKYVISVTVRFQIHVAGRCSVIVNRFSHPFPPIQVFDIVELNTPEFVASPSMLSENFIGAVEVEPEPGQEFIDEARASSIVEVRHCSIQCQTALANHGVPSMRRGL